MHAQTAERIVQAAGVTDQDTVLEIGPGTGMLTKVLLAKAKTVIAVEADDALVPQLSETFATEIAARKLIVVHQDIRTYDPAAIEGPYMLVANIPYYITGEIIRQFLTAAHKPISMTLLVQKEVAERIVRAKKESLLSLSVKVFGKPEYNFTVPRGAFRPAPNVDSAVMSIRSIDPSAFSSKEAEGWFFSVIRAGFAHKRKQLGGNLEILASRPVVLRALEEADLSPKVRPEDVPLAQWRALSDALPSAEKLGT